MPTIMMLILLIVIWWCTISRQIGMTRHLPFSECQYPAPGYIIMLDSCYTLASDALLHESRHKASIPPSRLGDNLALRLLLPPIHLHEYTGVSGRLLSPSEVARATRVVMGYAVVEVLQGVTKYCQGGQVHAHGWI